MVLRAQARARAISRASPAGTSAGGGAASRRRLCRECCDGMRSRFTSGTTGNTFFCVENVGTLGGRRFDSSPRRTNTKVRGLPVQEFDTFDASAFSVITNLVTPFWLLMVLAPNWTVTEKTMKSEWPIIICALVQLAVVLNGLTAEPIADVAERLQFFATEAVIKLSAMGKMRAYDSFVVSEYLIDIHFFSFLKDFRFPILF